jgi:hypothetical protein
MPVANYAALKQAIQDWYTADEIVPYLDYLIGMAERELRKDLRIRQMEVSASGTTASGVLAVPDDYLDMKLVRIDDYAPLKRKSLEWIHEKFPYRSLTGGGRPGYFAREASNLVFGPFPDNDYNIKYVYFVAPPFLSSVQTSNIFITDAPDVLLMCCLKHAAMFQREDERLANFSGLFEQAKTMLNTLTEHENGSGSSIEMQSDDLVYGGSMQAIGFGRLR